MPFSVSVQINNKKWSCSLGPGKLESWPGTLALNCLSAAPTQVQNQPNSFNHIAAISTTIALLHIRDSLSKIDFLVNTGAEVSIVPPSGHNLSKSPNLNLIAANGSHIKSFGTRQKTLKINVTRYP